jgi:ribosome-associated protein
VEKQLKDAGIRPSHVEGYQNSEWILLDCMDLVVHIFSKNARAFYDLERLWRDAQKMDVSLLIEKKTVKPGRRKTMKTS